MEASNWVRRFSSLVRSGGPVLDVACGSGRHARHFAELGHPIVAVDRDVAEITELAASLPDARIDVVEQDLEIDGGWPFSGQRFACIVVTNYLHRPLFPALVDAVEDGGLLIYETFARGNERFGRPKNPAFLLAENELLEHTADLRPIAFEQGIVERPAPAAIQRLCAWRGEGSRTLPSV